MHFYSLTVSVEQFSAELQSVGGFALLPREDHIWRSCCDENGSLTPGYSLPGLNNNANTIIFILNFEVKWLFRSLLVDFIPFFFFFY